MRETVRMRPSLMDALKMRIVNFSALARMLQEEIGEGSLEAVKAALIRIGEEVEPTPEVRAMVKFIESSERGIIKQSV